jgi:hypothetical protein
MKRAGMTVAIDKGNEQYTLTVTVPPDSTDPHGDAWLAMKESQRASQGS